MLAKHKYTDLDLSCCPATGDTWLMLVFIFSIYRTNRQAD
jgi:hypothetical protein